MLLRVLTDLFDLNLGDEYDPKLICKSEVRIDGFTCSYCNFKATTKQVSNESHFGAGWLSQRPPADCHSTFQRGTI